MSKLIMLKIGGGVITDKKVRYGLKGEVLKRLAREIAIGYGKLEDTDLIIGNGAGSFAHYSAKEYGTAEGFTDENGRMGAGWVRYDAVKLNQIVFEELLKVQVPVFSFSPSSFMQVNNGKAGVVSLGSVREAISKGLVPLVYGDVMVDQIKGSCIFSTERVFDELAKALAAEYNSIRVIHVSSEEGVMVGGKVFSEITNINIEQIQHELSGSGGVDVTGGMLHKVKECLKVAKLGVESVIVSGLVPGRVAHALAGSPVKGTRIC